jgi:hypothetical protein
MNWRGRVLGTPTLDRCQATVCDTHVVVAMCGLQALTHLVLPRQEMTQKEIGCTIIARGVGFVVARVAHRRPSSIFSPHEKKIMTTDDDDDTIVVPPAVAQLADAVLAKLGVQAPSSGLAASPDGGLFLQFENATLILRPPHTTYPNVRGIIVRRGRDDDEEWDNAAESLDAICAALQSSIFFPTTATKSW